MTQRVGFGEDAHALGLGQALVIGNVAIPESPLGALAHSDGDVLLHALSDALLSALALGDIGSYFPPSEPAFKDLDSAAILAKVLELLSEEARFELINVAAVVTLDTPKLGPHRAAIQRRVAELLNLAPERVGISFKTSEGLAPQHIQARVTVLLNLYA